ncbi:DNA polymerase III subunit epsilon [Sulfurivirga sp.]|uniref:DNA polymerase III subunit epsilon n=1 Tax=Sulfurivirga sp. TaxID=2614236 RepID=UPI0025F5F998|nr:DNA polymerase III subunit epsilon [Sulfurivirga sp.]
MRQIVLDTETTGMNKGQKDFWSGHRIIEIGAVELVGRRLTGEHYHQYINPEREVDEEALQVHGISNEFLADKPTFRDIVEEFMNFVSGAELIIHNAEFDVSFINYELSLLGKDNRWGRLEDHCTITDTLVLARQRFPGQRVNLDALCKRFGIDNSNRTLHGALLDSEILADVYLAMTGGQESLLLDTEDTSSAATRETTISNRPTAIAIPVVRAHADELSAHQNYLDMLSKKSGQQIDW